MTHPGYDAPVPGESRTTERPSVLEEAQDIINGQRRQDYGETLPSFEAIGKLWAVVLGVPEVSAESVALCLIQLKVARATNNLATDGSVHRDSVVDIAGYAGCLERIGNERIVREGF